MPLSVCRTTLLAPLLICTLVGTGASAVQAVPPPVAVSSVDAVQIGSRTFALSGTDVYRATDSLVLYTRASGAVTPTNTWGAEAVVVGGKVVALRDRQSTYAAATAIPSDGVVLSGHGAARDWLLAHARVGAAVTLPGATAVTPAPVAGAVQIGAASRVLTGTNVQRVTNALVLYTPAVGAATPTNTWGAEAVVVNGTVTVLRDRQRTYAGATAIPSNGVVLSGHGTSRDWLLTHARVGAAVTLPGSAPVAPAPVVAPSPAPVLAPSPAPAVPPPTTAPVAPVSGTTSTAPMGYPTKAVGAYLMMWSNSRSPQLSAVPADVNVVNLAFAQGTTPTLPGWASQTEASFLADAKALRARGVRIVLSVGGAGGAMDIANRQAFLDGVMAINAKIPLDGLDWDIEGSPMGAADVVYLSTTLKSLRGSAFAITMAPNGSNIDHYRSIAVQLHAKGALDMIGQQFYDAVVSPAAARRRIDQLSAAGIPDSKIGVGMMVGDADVYWTVQECIDAVKYIKATHPGIRGGYLWELGRAGTADWATRVGALLKGA